MNFLNGRNIAQQRANLVINDLEKPWKGNVTLRLLKGTKVLLSNKQSFSLDCYGKQTKTFVFKWLQQIGDCQIEAILNGI